MRSVLPDRRLAYKRAREEGVSPKSMKMRRGEKLGFLSRGIW